jgi:hypothetical protein
VERRLSFPDESRSIFVGGGAVAEVGGKEGEGGEPTSLHSDASKSRHSR